LPTPTSHHVSVPCSHKQGSRPAKHRSALDRAKEMPDEQRDEEKDKEREAKRDKERDKERE
jgi:hypothetical protein